MSLSENLQAYSRMKDELLRKYYGKVVVFYQGKLVAVENEIDLAMRKAKKKTGAKDFFVKELYTPEEQAATIL